MTVLEIILLIIGAACFTAGFFVSEKSKTVEAWEEKKEERRIHELIEKEIEKNKDRIYDSLEEKVDECLEKAERGLERISNEKIMAVNEYGDTVLSDINKSHDEAVFLYSMLNDKHDEILKSQSEVESATKEVRKTLKELENVKEETYADWEKNKQDILNEIEEKENRIELEKNILNAREDEFIKNVEEKSVKETQKKSTKKTVKRNPEAMDVSIYGDNHNEEIIKLYKEGKSNIAIAKELGLGVGEVNLVIALAKT